MNWLWTAGQASTTVTFFEQPGSPTGPTELRRLHFWARQQPDRCPSSIPADLMLRNWFRRNMLVVIEVGSVCGGRGWEHAIPDAAPQARCMTSMNRRTALHGLDAWQGDAARPPRGTRDRKDSPMRIVNLYCACSLPPRDTRVVPVLVLIIIVVVYGVSLVGSGRAMLIVVIMAVLTAAAEELVRAATLPSWPRTA